MKTSAHTRALIQQALDALMLATWALARRTLNADPGITTPRGGTGAK